MPTDKMARYAEIRAEHAQRLHRHGIVLHCYECEAMVRHEADLIARHPRGWEPQYHVNPDAVVVFYPAQDEAFSAMVRRVGLEATNRLRKVLEHPERCRLLCPAHLERAKRGWTKRREELRRLAPNVGYDTPPHDITLVDGVTINGVVVTPPGTVWRVDEFGYGPNAAPEWREEAARYRAEWLAEDGDPPPYDGGDWVRL